MPPKLHDIPEGSKADTHGATGRALPLPGSLVFKEGREGRKIESSRLMLEAVTKATYAFGICRNYSRLLERQTRLIQERRCRDKKEKTQVPDNPAQEEHLAAPVTLKDTLVAAMARKGLCGKIIEEAYNGPAIGKDVSAKDGDVSEDNVIAFLVEIGNDRAKIPLRESIMSSDDPVQMASSVLEYYFLGRKTRDSKAPELSKGVVSKPPPELLDIDEKDLERRYLTFDGIEQETGRRCFTYLADGVATSFGLTGDATGEGLLLLLDKIIAIKHMKRRVPFIAEIVEEHFKGKTDPSLVMHIEDAELRLIAKTLHNIVNILKLRKDMVPSEYQEAVEIIRNSGAFAALRSLGRNPALSKEEGKALIEAFSELELPANIMERMIRQHYSDEKGHLNEEGRVLLRDTLELAERGSEHTPIEALENISKAYETIMGIKLPSKDPEKLRSMHYYMMLELRRYCVLIGRHEIIGMPEID